MCVWKSLDLFLSKQDTGPLDTATFFCLETEANKASTKAYNQHSYAFNS